MTRVLRTLGAATVLLAVCSMTGPGAGAAPRAADPALDGAPAVGACHDVTTKETDAKSLPRPAVDCAAAHTSEVVAVSTLPAEVTWSSPRDEIVDAVSPTCDRAWDKATGGNPLRQVRSQYGVVWFQPTADQVALGARWFSCHLVVWDDAGLAPLTHPLPKLGKKIPDSVATCLTRSTKYTTCADAHAWRASYSFYVTGKPTKRNADRAAARTCPRRVTSRAWLLSQHDVPGKRFVVVCYSKTKR